MPKFAATPSKQQRHSPKPKLFYPLTRFDGINNSDDSSSITPDKSPDTLNQVLDSVGSIAPRNGYTKLLTTKLSIPSSNGVAYYKSDGTKQFVYGAGNFIYRYDNAGGSTLIPGATLNATSSYYFDVYSDVIYGVNGNDFFSYNGTTVTLISQTLFTNPTFIRVHKNRIWILVGSTLYFSDAGQPTSFPIGNFININTNDSQLGTGMEALLDQLTIFKTDSVWGITGEPLGSGSSTVIGNLSLRRANSDVGCVSAKTIKKVESYIIFAARSGIFIYENFQTRLISQDVNGTFRGDMNVNVLNLMWADYNPIQKKYLLGYASSASNTPDKVICYDLLVKHYTIWDDMPGGWATTFRFSQSETTLMGDPVKGNIYQLYLGYADIAGDNGTILAGTGSSTTTNTNYIINPSLEAGITGWTSSNGNTGVTQNTTAFSRTKSLSLASGNGTGGGTATFVVNNLTPNTQYTLSWYSEYNPAGGLATTTTMTLVAGGNTVGTNAYTMTASYTRQSITFTQPIGATSMAMTLSFANNNANLFDAFQLEVGASATAYFDGATTPAGANTYSWSGTTDASASILTTVVSVTTDATHLVDTSKTWSVGQFVDAKVQVGLGSGVVTTGIVTANGTNALTVGSWTNGVPALNQPYTIGGYMSYWKSRIFNFDAPQMTKRYKYFSIFTDTEAQYSLQFGVALDFNPLSFNQPAISLYAGTTLWDQASTFWDQAGLVWDQKGSLYRRVGLPGQGRYIQIMFGAFNANQPYRVFEYAITYKNKKDRPQ